MTIPTYTWEATDEEVARRAGIDPSAVLRFDTNTSPVAPPWVPEEAARAAPGSNEYPPTDYRGLVEAAAAYSGVEPDRVAVGAGADELIDLAAKAFLPPEGTAVTASPTYSYFEVITAQRPAEVRTVARPGPDFSLPVEPMQAAASAADLVWLCQPNNPTGMRDPDPAVAAVVEACSGVVVLDAAYAEYRGDEWGGWIDRYERLVVLRTLSKAFGLAGLRVGYALASPPLIEELNRRRPPGSISSISAALGARALSDPEPMRRAVRATVAERERLAARLRELGLEPLPSEANFLLVGVGDRAARLAEALLEQGLVVRTFSLPSPLADHLRITVRTPEQDDRLLDALERSLP